jgi:hypothetical protein
MIVTMAKTGTFPVKQGIDPRYLQSILTKDVTVLEGIYDLIDNSIDAARDRLLGLKKSRTDEYGLPSSYAGLRVSLRFARDSITLTDNGSGIAEKTLANRAFVIGSHTRHKFGLGWFGIGLKRSLIRLGTKYLLHTDDGKTSSEIEFEESDVLDRAEEPLEGRRLASKGKSQTLIRVTALRDGVQHELSAEEWTETVRKSLARRYGIFIAKGLSLTVNGKQVSSFGPAIRGRGPVKKMSTNFPAKDGVRVFIDSGMHAAYRLTNEADYDAAKPNSSSLTDQYGWYFVCNDRIVKIASRDVDLGWKTSWHPEYNGFVGWVRFVAEEPEKLPWDTKKTSIEPSSPVFRQIVDKLQEFADAYRVENKRSRKARRADKPGEAGEDWPGASPEASVPTRKKAKSKVHNDQWGYLLPSMTVALESKKLNSMVHEAERLSVDYCYAGALLLRATMEMALFEHIKLSGNYLSVQNMYFEEQEHSGRTFTKEQKKQFRPTFTHALDWLCKHDDYFPPERRRECARARTKFRTHLKELNGVAHENELIDSGKLKIIRNDTLPLLGFLLATDPRRDAPKAI